MSVKMKPKLNDHLRIVWTIMVKDILDSLNNKMLLGVSIGIVFLMLSSQALPMLLKGNAPPRAFYLDEGKSKRFKEIARSKDIDLIPQDSLEGVKTAVGGFAVPALGLILPVDFDQHLEGNTAITLQGFSIHWANDSEVTQLIAHFEHELGQRTGHIIRIQVADEGVYPQSTNLGFTVMIITGFVLGVMTVGLFLVPLLLMEEVENHTLEALLLSPARVSHLLTGKALAGLAFSCLAAAVMFALTWRWIVHWDLALLAVLLGALSTIGTGLLIGTINNQPSTVNLWSTLVLLVLLLPAFLWTTIAPKLSPGYVSLFQVLPSIAMTNLLQNAFSHQAQPPTVRASIFALAGFSFLIFGMVGVRLRRLNR